MFVPYIHLTHSTLHSQVQIEWNTEKADILWKVIELSRSSDNGGTDCGSKYSQLFECLCWPLSVGKGLAAHLEVPLPYLLYRVHTRFQEELRGLQDIQGALSPPATQPAINTGEEFPMTEKPTVVGRAVNRMTGSSRLSSSSRLSTALGVRARLNSLGNNSPRPKKASSSSTLTVQGYKKTYEPMRPTSPSSSPEDTDSDDDDAQKEEEADRNAEEQAALDRKLNDLQTMMTSDALGLVSTSRPKAKGKHADRGRMGVTSSRTLQESFRRDTLSSPSGSQSVSSASSRHNSIPDIPSPPPDSQPHSPISRQLSSSKSSSPPAVSPRSALGQSHLRYGPRVGRSVSEQGSNQGSQASSFSDISGT